MFTRKHSVITHIKDYRVAAVTSSSRFLIRSITRELGENLNIIIEQGAGSGVMTRELLKKLSKNGKLIAIEQNKAFLHTLQSIHDPRLIIVDSLAQHFEYSDFLQNNEAADVIITSIPFSFLSRHEREVVCKKAYQNLSNTGTFVIFHQYRLLMRSVVNTYFSYSKTRFIIRNIFPCFVFFSKK